LEPAVTPIRRIALPLTALLLAGCVSNPYSATYRPSVSPKLPRAETGPLPAPSEPPRLLTTNDIRGDALKLLEQGYLPLGRSSFTGQEVDARAALAQAQAVGADVVLVMQKFVRTDTVSVPVTEWSPDRSITQRDTTQTISSAGGAVQTTVHEGVTTLVGEYETHYVPQTVETFDHFAGYWRKAPTPLLGILASDLTQEQRQALQSNRGVEVRVVVRKSPAYLADVLPGDIVRKLGGHQVTDCDDFFHTVQSMAGLSVTLDLWRAGAAVSKKVTLNPR
jgi:hypothetical protein